MNGMFVLLEESGAGTMSDDSLVSSSGVLESPAGMSNEMNAVLCL